MVSLIDCAARESSAPPLFTLRERGDRFSGLSYVNEVLHTSKCPSGPLPTQANPQRQAHGIAQRFLAGRNAPLHGIASAVDGASLIISEAGETNLASLLR